MNKLLNTIPKYRYFAVSDYINLKRTLPKVFLEVKIENKVIGKIVVELFENIVPKTTENFRVLAEGTFKGLQYKNTEFHQVTPGLLVQGGDVNKLGGESIYGKKFFDESFALSHDKEGLLSMANDGPDSNGSQFFITLGPAQWLDRKNVVFGQVVEGMNIVGEIEKLGSVDGKPSKKVLISNSGNV